MNSRALQWVAAGLAAASVVAVILVAVVLLVGGGSDDVGTPVDVAQKVGDSIRQPGMVYHAVGSDGSVVWIDAENQFYRRKETPINGGLTSVGHGWTEITFDATKNTTKEADRSPSASQRPRIDDPMVRWADPLAALGFSNSLTVSGPTVVDGINVITLEATTPVVDSAGNAAGLLFGRVEVDAKTYLPHAFQSRQTLADGTTPTPALEGVDPSARITYTTDFIARSTLPADFFDRSVVEQQVQTNQKGLQNIRDDGLTPLWLGEYYDGAPYGELQLPPTISVYDTPDPPAGDIHYALVSPTLQAENAVVIRLSPDATTFTHPEIPQFAGDLPENSETVTIGGGTGTLYTSILTVEALPCPSGATCPASSATLYRRLVFMHGSTAVQIEVSPRIDANGNDNNGFNSRDGIISLVGVLTEVPADVTLPTPPAS